jgi:TIR domain
MKPSPATSDLPENCFISHSYRDAEARKCLLTKLPAQVRPIIFPPITVPPEQFISNELIHALLRCDGLIYLQGGASARSFWVAFERDYALRAGKKIFAYDPTTDELRQDTSAPLHLPIFPSYSRQDAARVGQMLGFMKTERYFDVWLDVEDIPPGSNVGDYLTKGLLGQLEAGGYVVAFWSKAGASSPWVEWELKQAFSKYPSQVLPALLEQPEMPLHLHPLFGTIQLYGQEGTEDWFIRLYGDHQRSEAQRLDDLIVRLYWLIYRNTRQNNLV